jgi:hypothetical protein
LQQANDLHSADIGDFEKTMAVSTVMIQSVITFLMATKPGVGQQFFLGGIYEAIKFSASAFIFGILFSTIRTHPQATLKDYPRFMKNRWHVLFIPSIWWTLIYLLFLPQLQQHGSFHNWQGFCWQFISGNAAPHLWYNVMMLQFIILMPLFWWLARFVHRHPRRGTVIFTIMLLGELAWHYLYELRVFHGPDAKSWYLIDRFFLSFLIFAVGGTLLWQFYEKVTPWLMKHWLTQVIGWLALFYFVTVNFFSYGYPVKLSNAPYYLPSMIFYNLSTIFLIATFALYMQHFRNQWLPFIHWVALYAHRAYLGHFFWLYWVNLALNRLAPQLGIGIKLPLLTMLTIGLAFAGAYFIHRAWSAIKVLLHIGQLTNG